MAANIGTRDDGPPARMDEGPSPWGDPLAAAEGEATARIGSAPARFAPLSKFRPMTDLGNAERLADRNGSVIRYLEDRAQWRAWAPPVWRRDDMGPLYRATAATARSIRDEAAQLDSTPNISPTTGRPTASDREKMLAHAAASESERMHKSAIALAGHIPPVSCTAASFDTDPWLLNTPGWIVDLRSDGGVSECRPEAMMTRCTRGKYNAMAEAPRWKQFIAEITCGDDEFAAYLQRAVGQTLIGTQREHVFFFCFGGGGNGKGKFLDAILYALGDYGMTLPTNLLIEKKFESHPTELADLEGARMAVGSEVPKGAAWDEVRIKSLSGGDRIRARKMRKDFFEFDASHTFWVSGNDRPRIRGMDKGIWRRMRLLPFLADIPADKQDADLPAKLIAEADGVLWWALEGCRAYMQQGLGTCAAVESATACYREDEDLIGQFLADCCTLGEALTVDKGMMRAALRTWFSEREYKTPSDRAIRADFTGRKIAEGQLHSGARCWRGVGLTTAPKASGNWRDDYHGGH